MAALTLRVHDIVAPVRARHYDYDGWVPPPVPGELLRSGGGALWMHVPHEANKHFNGVRALLATAPSSGYVLRSSTLQRPYHQGIRRRSIVNLHPRLLSAHDWMDISGKVKHNIGIEDREDAKGDTWLCDVRYDYEQKREVFPTGTVGFFYVHVPDPLHPVGAQLRFRIVDTPDPLAFDSGHDLRTPSGAIWYRWIPSMIHNRYKNGGRALASLVVRQGLVDSAVMKRWQDMGDQFALLYSPFAGPGSPPFLYDFSKLKAVILGFGNYARVAKIWNPFMDRRKNTSMQPYQGAFWISISYKSRWVNLDFRYRLSRDRSR
jgi:hypothetical protein